MTQGRQPERDCYAIVAPGLEQLAAAELQSMGITPDSTEPGGVAFKATAADIFRANLHLRTASRVIVRIASFRAKAFHELERLARTVAWEEFVAPGGAARLRVTCRKSRLYHSDGVAERIAGAISRRVKGATVTGAKREADDDAAEPEREEPSQRFLVRFDHDVCTISADSSGQLLHRRGYRLATAKAPLRETLAAGMLLAAGYDGTRPLIDPMCGAGTIAIEAALMARRIAPGLNRAFSCELWPGAPRAEFDRVRDAACAAIVPSAPARIVASDRDAGAAEAALANAQRAGVAGDVEVRRGALSGIQPPPGPGLLITNPPYGVRASAGAETRNLYAQLGNVARAKCAGWSLAFLAADRAMDAQVKLPLIETLKFRNGGIPVRLVRAEVPRVVAAASRGHLDC